MVSLVFRWDVIESKFYYRVQIWRSARAANVFKIVNLAEQVFSYIMQTVLLNPLYIVTLCKYLGTPYNNNMLEFMILKVGCAERHNEVAETNQRTVGFSEDTNNNMGVQNHSGYLVSRIKTLLNNIFNF